jgi:hypothetical protein
MNNHPLLISDWVIDMWTARVRLLACYPADMAQPIGDVREEEEEGPSTGVLEEGEEPQGNWDKFSPTIAVFALQVPVLGYGCQAVQLIDMAPGRLMLEDASDWVMRFPNSSATHTMDWGPAAIRKGVN